MSGRPGLYPYWVVACLMLASAFSFLDRLVLSLLIDPIRTAFGLEDWQVSLLAGTAFALFYVLFAFVFGRWVDRHSRRNAVSLGILLWSLATAACGFAGSFWSMFAARALVGVGEGSLNPSAYSLVADYFDPRRRGFAMAIFACGASIGGGLAMVAGGQVVQWALSGRAGAPLLNGVAQWQLVFIIVGLPGLAVAALFFLTVREPALRMTAADRGPPPSIADAARYVAQHWRVFLPIFAGFSFLAVTGYAFTVWGPAYYMRVHGLTPGDIGLLFGIGYGVLGTLGVLAGGALSDRMAAAGRINGPVLISLVSAAVQAPLFVGAYLVGDFWISAALFCAAMMVASMVGGLQAAMVQSLSPARMRGLLAALYTTCVTVAGLGIGPTLTALATDYVFGGPNGIGAALALTTGFSLVAAVLLIALGRGGARRLATRLQG